MSSPQKHPLIILAEEEASQRQDIVRYLREAGFEVIEAADSEKALALLDAHPDAKGLVTDAHLPGRIDGHQLASLVSERRPGMAVIMMSGHSDRSSGPVPQGGTFVAKPYLFERLAPELNRLIRTKD
jgi:DNA-binding NtrC family response regulator